MAHVLYRRAHLKEVEVACIVDIQRRAMNAYSMLVQGGPPRVGANAAQKSNELRLERQLERRKIFQHTLQKRTSSFFSSLRQ